MCWHLSVFRVGHAAKLSIVGAPQIATDERACVEPHGVLEQLGRQQLASYLNLRPAFLVEWPTAPQSNPVSSISAQAERISIDGTHTENAPRPAPVRYQQPIATRSSTSGPITRACQAQCVTQSRRAQAAWFMCLTCTVVTCCSSSSRSRKIVLDQCAICCMTDYLLRSLARFSITSRFPTSPNNAQLAVQTLFPGQPVTVTVPNHSPVIAPFQPAAGLLNHDAPAVRHTSTTLTAVISVRHFSLNHARFCDVPLHQSCFYSQDSWKRRHR